jgi:hypothetical protein
MYVLPYGQMSLWGVQYYNNNIIYLYKVNLIKSHSGRFLINLIERKFIKIYYSIFGNIKPNKKFMSLFIGFMDGDGYFDIGEQKQYNKRTKTLAKSTLRIRLATNVNIRDLSTLRLFREVLGVGNISYLINKKQVKLTFYKRDLINVILPLLKTYGLKFLNKERIKQFSLLTYILDNNIKHWDQIDSNLILKTDFLSDNDIINLDYFNNWLIGFTMAEGSFGIKTNGSAFFQIKQKGEENYEIIKAICLAIAKRGAKPIKADSANCYQLTLSSKVDIEKVIKFFSFSDNHSLFGYKLKQYNL